MALPSVLALMPSGCIDAVGDVGLYGVIGLVAVASDDVVRGGNDFARRGRNRSLVIGPAAIGVLPGGR